jgi:hypothetical protein
MTSEHGDITLTITGTTRHCRTGETLPGCGAAQAGTGGCGGEA